VVDLGLSPISNAFIPQDKLAHPEVFHPLRAQVCHHCWLVQLAEVTAADTHFHADYVYFSSFSTSWLAHAKAYVEAMIPRLALDASSRVIEVASNDGYLLQNFVAMGIPCLGIEPTANTAAAARTKGVETRELFFGTKTARNLVGEGWQADLLIGNNVLAHVPDINDFIQGIALQLKPEGVATLEFPHLLKLLAENQFDTLYHEHYSYLSLTALQPILARAGLRCFDVDTLPTHGGSLRVYLCRAEAGHPTHSAVSQCLQAEQAAGLDQLSCYRQFAEKVHALKRDLLQFMIEAKREGRSIVAYGAAAKGNTLLNYCGIGTDFIDYVVDKNPVKQGQYLPGTRIPVRAPEQVFDTRPDYLLILPWNLKDEIVEQMAEIRSWGGRFIVPIPTVEVVA